MMSETDTSREQSDRGFPENVPWRDLWQLAQRIKDGNVQAYFEEAIWCLRMGGFRAAAVVGWAAVALHLGNAARRLPDSILAAHMPRGARSQDNEAFLRVCRRLTLFGLRRVETTPEDQKLSGLLDLRNKWAHGSVTADTQSRIQVFELLRDLGELFLIREIGGFRFGDYAVVAELAKNRALQYSVEPIEARQVVAFVSEDRLLDVSRKLLEEYLAHSYSDTRPDMPDGHNDVEAVAEMVDDDAALREWSKVDTNLARLWVEVYERLGDADRVLLLGALAPEFAERTYCLAEDQGDRIELVPRGQRKPIVRGQRSLGELAHLMTWKKGRSPSKYKYFFYACFVANPGDLVGVPDAMQQEMVDHSPEEFRGQLKEALHG